MDNIEHAELIPSLNPEELLEPEFEPHSINDDEAKVPFKVTIEPMLFLQMLGLGICGVSVQSFFMKQICMSVYNSSSICSNLSIRQENSIEEIYSQYSTYQTLIELGPPILFSMFLAPWLDKYGTKDGMVLPLIGLCGSLFIYLFLSIIGNKTHFSPALILLASVPISLTGGLVAFLLSAFTYIGNITTVKNRTFRIAIVEGCWMVGSPIGVMTGAAILKSYGYSVVFSASVCLYALALVYSILFIQNDKPPRPENEATIGCSKIVEFFNYSALWDTVRTFFRKRSGNKRLLVILLLAAICLRLLVWMGAMKVAYMYTRSKFSWNETSFSTFTTVDGLISIAGTGLLAVVGMKILKVPDTMTGLIGAVSGLGGSIIWTVATKAYWMYIGAAVQMFSGLTSIVIRSMISKLVPADELGKIFSFLSCAEATMPLISASLFNLLYMKTVDTFIGAVYLVCCGMNSMIIVLFVYFHFAMKNQLTRTHHVTLENEDSDSDMG